MTSSESNDWAEWLGFGLEIALQIVIAAGVVLLGVLIWPSEMIHMAIGSIPLHHWAMTGGAALIAGLGLVMLYFAVAGVITALRSGPRRIL